MRLFHGDCLDLMGDIPAGSVDLILADLPYGTTACKWDTVIPFAPLWAHYKRVIKPNGAIVLTASQPFTSALVMSNPKWFRYEFAWDKVGVTGFLDAKRRPLRRHENILVFSAGRTVYCPQMGIGKAHGIRRRGRTTELYGKYEPREHYCGESRYPTSVLRFTNATNAVGKLHPTQKPVALMEYLIRTYTNAGETVLDNTMGSGTTGVACINTGRAFIGIERDAEIYATATKRINDALAAKSEQLIA